MNQYYEKNREKFKTYYLKNKEKIHEYYLKKKDTIKIYNHNYYLKKKTTTKKNKINNPHIEQSLILVFD